MAETAQERLIAALREHALVIGEVTLTSGRTASYYVDAKRAILLPDGFRALGELVAGRGGARRRHGRGRDDDGRGPGRVRGARRRRAREGVLRAQGARRSTGSSAGSRARSSRTGERCLVVEDVVTTGGSTVKAIERIREEGLEIAGVVSVLDRLAGRRRGDPGRARTARPTRRSRRSTTSTRTGRTASSASQASISRRAIEYGGASIELALAAAAASISARSNQRTSASSSSPGARVAPLGHRAEAEHQRAGERPRLGGDVGDRVERDARLLEHLAPHRLLERLARLDVAGQEREAALRPARLAAEQQAVAAVRPRARSPPGPCAGSGAPRRRGRRARGRRRAPRSARRSSRRSGGAGARRAASRRRRASAASPAGSSVAASRSPAGRPRAGPAPSTYSANSGAPSISPRNTASAPGGSSTSRPPSIHTPCSDISTAPGARVGSLCLEPVRPAPEHRGAVERGAGEDDHAVTVTLRTPRSPDRAAPARPTPRASACRTPARGPCSPACTGR